MNKPFTPPETARPALLVLVELDDGRTGLVIDADARRFFLGLANGLAISGVLLVVIAAVVAAARWAL